MRAFVAGGTGVVGRPLVASLNARGHEVTLLSRKTVDVFDERAVLEAVERARPDVVVHQLTALPRRLHPRKLAQIEPTNRLRTEGGRILAAAAKHAGARFVAQSISFVTQVQGPALSTEDEALVAPENAGWKAIVDAVRAIEGVTLAMSGCVLRYGMFYGAGTMYAPDGAAVEDVRARRLPIVGEGTGVFSFVHIEDAAEATVLAIERGATGVLNVTDDDPAPVRVWIPELARLLEAPAPLRVPAWIASPILGPYGRYLMLHLRGASNAKAKRELGWTPRHASWREGFRAMLSSAREGEAEAVGG
jgi:nucleoside-diphosphate-sugar epimerase